MGTCNSCGISIPDGQNFCSMCYGDPAYGNDGYYEEWLRGLEEMEIKKKNSYSTKYRRR